ncbi:MAG TPA: hypothetical protein PK634_10470, partial [Kiritimatiellia bacterium]|nr:hypothetical protein [Kiritimatiellia bacterium]
MADPADLKAIEFFAGCTEQELRDLAPFLLSNLLLDRLKASVPARIVNVNAGLYVKGEADPEKLPTGENFNRFKTYMHSKLCNMYFTTELARRLEGSGVTVTALHPGVTVELVAIRTQGDIL